MPMPALPPSAPKTVPAPNPVRFQAVHSFRHLLMVALFALLCGLMYGNVTDGPFQFDDEPNITRCPPVQMETLSWDGLVRAAKQSQAPNRILVSCSFALQHWAAQFLPRLVDDKPSRPDLLAWQFRMFNYVVHVLAGFAVYLLFLRLLQLPRVERHLARHAWPLAALAALVWFCSPVQTQAVTYIVQRAVSMAALFYALGLVCYLEARAAVGISWRRQQAFLGLGGVACLCSVFSKEIGVTFPLAVILIEYLLIWEPRRSPRFVGVIVGTCVLLAVVGPLWFFGRPADMNDRGETETGVSVKRAVRRIRTEILGNLLSDRIASQKVRLTPRQRLLTQTRVVAMFQSLLVFPAPWRLNLDYDFLESTDFFVAGEYETLDAVLPLLLVIGLAGVCLALPGPRRVRILWLLVLVLAGLEWVCGEAGCESPVALSRVWLRPWPIPALAWHALLRGFAALYSYRRPLLAFGIVFFYIGNLVESTVIMLELVHEHRMYLPSIGFYLALVLLAYEAFFPAREEDLGPRPLPALV